MPAFYSGLRGMRISHWAIMPEGEVPLAPSYDTQVWFAREADTLAWAGVPFFGEARPSAPDQVLIATDFFDEVVPKHASSLPEVFGGPLKGWT